MDTSHQADSFDFPLPQSGPFSSLDDSPEVPKPLFAHKNFIDRELSWLAFNARIQELSNDPSIPLLERFRFAAIFSDNLDEYFGVQVAGLKRRLDAGLSAESAAGISGRDLFNTVRERAAELLHAQDRIVTDNLRQALKESVGICYRRWSELSESERSVLRDYARRAILPALIPLAVARDRKFPFIAGRQLNLLITMSQQSEPGRGSKKREPVLRTARVGLPAMLDRFIFIRDGQVISHDAISQSAPGATLIPIEEIIANNLGDLFPGMVIHSVDLFRVIRNENLSVDEDDAEDLLHALEVELKQRPFGGAIKLEVDSSISKADLKWLRKGLDLTKRDVVEIKGSLDRSSLKEIADLDLPHLRYEPLVPHTPKAFTGSTDDMFAFIARRDILVHHPFDSHAGSVVAFVEKAAKDPRVQAIKYTLYRTSGDSPIVKALICAARAGKQVLVVVEIQARFDEENNISWARRLEEAGAHVIYGVPGLKTHAKLCMVVRQEGNSMQRYCHIGTGNYHHRMARVFEDFSLFTAEEGVGNDIAALFNHLSGFAPRVSYESILVAPKTLRGGLAWLIEREKQHALAGREARIRIKCNALIDERVIARLYDASNAGVKIDLSVRGMCAIRPGIPGLSENISVRSTLGRFLEHSRIYTFANGGDELVLMGSPDPMRRNLDQRIEVLVAIEDAEVRDKLVEYLEIVLGEDTASWRLSSDGTWSRKCSADASNALNDAHTIVLNAGLKDPSNK